MPSIKAYIFTSSPVFDLNSEEPFTFTVDLVFDHDTPITLHNREASRFKREMLEEPGLTFTDTETGIAVSRPRMLCCLPLSSNDDGSLTETYAKNFTIVQPGEKHTLTSSMSRTWWRVTPPDGQPPIQSVEEAKAYLEPLPKVWKWFGAEGFENGKTYKVGIHQDAAIQGWLEGDKETLLKTPPEERNSGAMRKMKPIPFDVVQAATFTVRRPETDLAALV